MNKHLQILFFLISQLFIFSCTTAKSGESVENIEQVNQTEKQVKLVEPIEFKELISQTDAQIIDVRTLDEYNSGNISNSTLINFYDDNFKDKINDLNKDKAVFVYCASGGRSKKATDMMVEMGFKKIYELKGGYNNWLKTFDKNPN